jgi:hypothetical protein
MNIEWALSIDSDRDFKSIPSTRRIIAMAMLLILTPVYQASAALPVQTVEFYLTHSIERGVTLSRCRLLSTTISEKDADCVNARKALSLLKRPVRPR